MSPNFELEQTFPLRSTAGVSPSAPRGCSVGLSGMAGDVRALGPAAGDASSATHAMSRPRWWGHSSVAPRSPENSSTYPRTFSWTRTPHALGPATSASRPGIREWEWEQGARRVVAARGLLSTPPRALSGCTPLLRAGVQGTSQASISPKTCASRRVPSAVSRQPLALCSSSAAAFFPSSRRSMRAPQRGLS